MADGDDLSAPLRLHRTRIPAEWVDYNGHMTESRYLEVMSEATDAVLHYVGVDGAYMASTGTYFTAESHVSFLEELHAEQVVEVSTQVLGADERRLHMFHRLHRAGEQTSAAECETMLLHVARDSGRAAPAAPHVTRRVEKIAAAHASLPRPDRAGRRVGERKGAAST
jgi:carnitine 3-dehydrogenase